MKKNLLKTSLVAGSLLAFGFLMSSQCNTVNAQAVATTGTTADVELTVNPGTITIGIDYAQFDNSDETLNLGAYYVSNVLQTASGHFGNTGFWLNDQKGSELGYYTTVQVSNLLGQADTTNHVIPASGIRLKSTAIVVITGEQGQARIDLSNSAFQTANEPLTYFAREASNNPANAGRLGRFGDKLNIEVDIPAHTVADTYKGTITYTLFDEQAPATNP